MSLLTTILLLMAGLVGAAPLVVRRFPNMSGTIDSIRRFSSMIGIYLLVSGIIRLFRLLDHGGLGLVEVAILVAMLGLGFLQGFEFIMELFRNNENLSEKTENLRMKVVKYQESLGVLALIVAVLRILRII